MYTEFFVVRDVGGVRGRSPRGGLVTGDPQLLRGFRVPGAGVGGHGPDQTAQFFESSLGLKPGKRHATAAGAAEAGGTELVVVDYKTGRHLLTVDDARSSLALALYALAAERALRRPCRRVELHHLPSGQVLTWSHTEESLARHLGRAETIARECAAADQRMGEGMAADRYDEVFPPRPGPSRRTPCWCWARSSWPPGLT